jgi:hypothetical protein
MKPLVFVGVDLIHNFGIDSVYISQTPRSRYIDMIVFDRIGLIVGKVKNVYYKEDTFEINLIKIKINPFKSFLIDSKYIKNIKRNIFLNITKKEVQALIKNQDKIK